MEKSSVRKSKTISKHDLIRGIKNLNNSVQAIARRLDLMEKNFGHYVEMKGDVKILQDYRENKHKGKIPWMRRLKNLLFG